MFAGGFTHEAARSVIVDARGATADALLDALRHQALLWADRTEAGLRLGMYEPIRQFVLEAAAPEDRDAIAAARARHAAWAGARSDGIDPIQDEGDHRALQRELPNLLAASAASRDDPAQAARIGLAATGIRHHRALPDALLDLPTADLPRPLAARVAFARARHIRTREPSEAAALAANALERAEGAFAGRCMSLLGLIAYERGDLDTAAARYAEGLAIARRVGDRLGELYGVGDLGRVAHVRGDLARAEACYTEALALGERIGDRSVAGLNTDVLGWIYLHTGRLDRAEAAFRSAVEAHTRRSEGRYVAVSRLGLGSLLAVRGNLEDATAALAAAETQARRFGDTVTGINAGTYLALTLTLAGDDAAAHEALERTALLAAAHPHPTPRAGLLHAAALIAWLGGDLAGARAQLTLPYEACGGAIWARFTDDLGSDAGDEPFEEIVLQITGATVGDVSIPSSANNPVRWLLVDAP